MIFGYTRCIYADIETCSVLLYENEVYVVSWNYYYFSEIKLNMDLYTPFCIMITDITLQMFYMKDLGFCNELQCFLNRVWELILLCNFYYLKVYLLALADLILWVWYISIASSFLYGCSCHVNWYVGMSISFIISEIIAKYHFIR